MKTLILLRHAKSSWDDLVARDFDRPLNRRGRKAARTIGRELRSLGIEFDRVVASPAVRVVETLVDVAEGYGQAIAPDYDRRIYLASASTLLEIVQDADEGAERLLIVGHNPGLERLAMLLTRDEDGIDSGGGSNGLRAELAIKYPTATVAEIILSIDHWRDAAEGSGRLSRFIRPRDLDPELGPDEESH